MKAQSERDGHARGSDWGAPLQEKNEKGGQQRKTHSKAQPGKKRDRRHQPEPARQRPPGACPGRSLSRLRRTEQALEKQTKREDEKPNAEPERKESGARAEFGNIGQLGSSVGDVNAESRNAESGYQIAFIPNLHRQISMG